MRPTHRRVTHFCTIAILFGASTTLAQAPAGADRLTPTAVAESVAVLRHLDSALLANPDDATAWHRRGMIAWALYERDRTKPPIAGLDWTTLGRMADTSLRRAIQLAPDSANYFTMAGRYLLASGVTFTRWASYGMFEKGVEAARRSGDSLRHAEVAVEAGRVHWRRYDAVANRSWEKALGTDVANLAIRLTAEELKRGGGVQRVHPKFGYTRSATLRAREELERAYNGPQWGFAGELDYIQAEVLFREAFDAAHSYARAYRQLAMLLAERRRWKELADVAYTRIRTIPTDEWAWMTYAMAKYRMGDSKVSATAFDSAFAIMPPSERARLDRLDRVLRHRDSTVFVGMSRENRAMMERAYWLASDPFWSRDGNEPRVEFLARVAYAELRWTVEEMNVRGADTDRGNIYVRLGPPDAIITFPFDISAPVGDIAEPPPNITWTYDFEPLTFGFVGPPTLATARLARANQAEKLEDLDMVGVSWRNMEPMRIDSMPTQAARFRAGDSVDVFVAVLPPVDQIRRFADLGGPVRTDFWLHLGGTTEIARDSVTPVSQTVQRFTHRVAPGAYVYRAEASMDGSRGGGRSTAVVLAGTDTLSGFGMRGFGMSDVLITAPATARASTARRWSDVTIEPVLGAVRRGSSVSLLWENYEVGERDGTARYRIAVALQRERSAMGRITARIVGSVGGAIGVDRTDDRLTMTFERAVAHAPILLDSVNLALAETPPGSYLLSVEIADRVSGRTTTRTMRLVIQ